jgi:hypothetical protein
LWALPILPYFAHRVVAHRTQLLGTRRRKEAVQGRSSMGRFHPGVGSRRNARPLRGQEAVGFPNAINRVWRPFMAGNTSDRPWAEGFVTGSPAASGIIPKWLASSAYGRAKIFPPMNRRNPGSRRMARGYGSRCGTRGQRLPPEPPLLFALGGFPATAYLLGFRVEYAVPRLPPAGTKTSARQDAKSAKKTGE